MASTERVLLAKKLSLEINKPLIISGGKTIKEARVKHLLLVNT